MKYSIIIVAYKAEEKLYKCLDSLAENMPDGPAEIIIVDNNEDQDLNLKSEYIYKLLKDQINGYCSVEEVKAGKNIGYAAGANLGATYAQGRYLVFVNPDTIVFEGWSEELSKAIESSGDVGAVGPISNFVAGLQRDSLHLKPSESMEVNAKTAMRGMAGRFVETDMLIGFFLMTKKTVFEKLGGFDPDLFLGCDDLDYSLKLKESGHKMLIASGVFIHHFGHESFRANPKSESLTKQTEEIFCQKLHDKFDGKVPEAEELWGIPIINTQVNNKPAKLSVCMIVRDATGDLIELLPQLDWVDEVVIVDTDPSGPSTPIRSELKNCRQFHYKWNDSFSEARNFAKSKCTGDWILWLDADDRIPEGTGELIRAIIDKPGPKTKAKQCHFALRIKDMGQGIVYCPQPRLFPNLPGMEWRGRVHENYLDSAAKLGLIPVIVDNIEIIHTGYADPEVNKKKSERNLRLLNMEPDSEEKFFHMGKQFHSLGEYKKAVEYYAKALRLTPEYNTEGRDHLRYSIALCRYQDGGFDGEFKDPDTLEYLDKSTKKDATFLMGEWLYFNGVFDSAKKAFEDYLSYGDITDVRGTHQDSFRVHSKKRLEDINEPIVQ